MRWLVAIVPLIAGIGAAIAYGARRRRGLGEVDPFDQTADPWAPEPDEPEHDNGCLILGKAHFKLGEKYRVCLTPNQEQKLFAGKRRSQKKLGCGVFACAYTSPTPSRVIKLTRDSEDVAALIKAQKTGRVPKIFAVYKLAQGGRTLPQRNPFTMLTPDPVDVPVYALVVERLRTFSSAERDAVDETLHDLRDQVATGKMTSNEFCDSQKDDEGNVGCDDIQMGVLAAWDKLFAAGIKWDDIHAGNIGYDQNGRLKVLDLGLTKTELKRRIKILEGLGLSDRLPRLAPL